MSLSILIVDDEVTVRRLTKRLLQDMGFTAFESARGEEALSLIALSRFDMVLLDINMPGMGGIATCHAIRKAHPSLPILMLTVRDAEQDKVDALNAGADDYVTKPFSIRELVARIKAVARRVQPAEKVCDSSIICIGEVELDTERRLFLKRGVPIHLTPMEFSIIHYLMLHRGRAVSHRRLLTSIRGAEFREEVEYLRTYMRQLRRKIEDDPSNPSYILTDPYVGYRFRESALLQ